MPPPGLKGSIFNCSIKISFTFPVPGKPPANLTAYNTSSTSIGVSWDPVPKPFQYGNILGYRVYLLGTQQQLSERRKRSPPASENEIFGDTTNLTMEFRGLEIYSNYCVQATAYTRIGESNRTNVTCLLTEEDGKNLRNCSSSMFFVNTEVCIHRMKTVNLIHSMYTVGRWTWITATLNNTRTPTNGYEFKITLRRHFLMVGRDIFSLIPYSRNPTVVFMIMVNNS